MLGRAHPANLDVIYLTGSIYKDYLIFFVYDKCSQTMTMNGYAEIYAVHNYSSYGSVVAYNEKILGMLVNNLVLEYLAPGTKHRTI